jgi:hypothetical protein
VEAAKEAADIIEALRQRLFDLGEEVETWKSRYGAEHEEHEATMRAWEEERSGM